MVNEHSVNALLMMGRLLRDDGDKEEASRAFSEGLKRIKARLKESGEDRKEWLILGLAFAPECEAQAELESWAAQLREFPTDELPAAVRHQLEALAGHG